MKQYIATARAAKKIDHIASGRSHCSQGTPPLWCNPSQ